MKQSAQNFLFMVMTLAMCGMILNLFKQANSLKYRAGLLQSSEILTKPMR